MSNLPNPACIRKEVKRVNLDGLVVPRDDEEQLCKLYCTFVFKLSILTKRILTKNPVV
jgi:hypothetical protein